MERSIIHMDLDSFFVSVERLLDSSLIGKPVIIGGTSDRGVVSSCSYEARKFGVRSAMPSIKARQLCPHAIFIRGNMEQYSKFSHEVTQIIEDRAPLFEKASIDEHYIDITGMDKYVKNSLLWTQELRQTIIKETGLPISFGLSTNKTVSKIATDEGKPNGEKYISAGEEKNFLAPLSVKKMPGIGEKTYPILEKYRITKLEHIQAMSIVAMQKILGDHGSSIWRRANGIDNNPVEPYHEQKSMSTETTFHKDTADTDYLKNVLVNMVDGLSFDLRQSKKVAGSVTLKLRSSDFQTHTFQMRIPYTASDHVLLERVTELFTRNYTGGLQIRLIGVKYSNLVSGFNQVDLFDDTEEKANLYQALDKIRMRFGSDAIGKACSRLKDKK